MRLHHLHLIYLDIKITWCRGKFCRGYICVRMNFPWTHTNHHWKWQQYWSSVVYEIFWYKHTDRDQRTNILLILHKDILFHLYFISRSTYTVIQRYQTYFEYTKHPPKNDTYRILHGIRISISYLFCRQIKKIKNILNLELKKGVSVTEIYPNIIWLIKN